MSNTINKKYNFDNIIYILFFFFIIIFIKFSTVSVKANTYKIVNLEISKPYDNNFEKEKVIDKAFKKAFEELILKITTIEKDKIKKISNLKSIYSLIDSFSIVDEKFIENKYVSKFDVEFNKKELFNYLEKKNIFPSIPKEKNLLLIPILINNEKNEVLLFSENTFYINWNKYNERHFLLNYILPNEDIEDINLIKKNINNIEDYNFKEIVTKYEIDDYIILILFQKKNDFNALIKSNLNNKLIISNKKFNWEENQSEKNIIKDLKFELENQWKKLNIINVSIKLPITLSINSKNYELIKKLETKSRLLSFFSNLVINSWFLEFIEIVKGNFIETFIIFNFFHWFSNSNFKLFIIFSID